MAEPVHDPVAGFVAKWEAREPTLRLLPAFLPAALQRRVPLWLSLLAEFDEAMFETSDPSVSRTKLAWWGEELAAGAAVARHPLARALLLDLDAASPPAATWREFARQAIALSLHEDSAVDWDAQARRWQPFAAIVAEIEAALCGAAAADLIARQWWLARCLRALRRGEPARSGLPLLLRTRLPEGRVEALRDGAANAWRALAEGLDLPAAAVAPLHRRLQLRLDRHRLQRLGRGQALAVVEPIAPLRGLWYAWSAARMAQR